MTRNLNIWDVSQTNQVQMSQSEVGRGRLVGGLQMLIGLWLMLRVCSLSELRSCMSNCWCLFLRMVKTMIWREKERSRIRVVHMDNLRVEWIKSRMHGFSGVTKGVDEKIDEGVLQ